MNKTILLTLRGVVVISTLTIATFFITAEYKIVLKKEVEAQCVALPIEDGIAWLSADGRNINCPAGYYMYGLDCTGGCGSSDMKIKCRKLYP